MDSIEEVTTPCTPEELPEYPFEYTARKRKGKRTGRKFFFPNRNKADQQPSNNTDEEVETTYNQDDTNDTDKRVSLDGQMKREPKILAERETFKSEEHLSNEKVKFIDDDTKSPHMEMNIKALTKHSITYELEKFEKRTLLIFSHQNIDGYEPNPSTEKDEAELKKTFAAFGFDFIVEKDLAKDELMNKLREFSQQDLTAHGCVAVAILTLVSEDGLIWAKDKAYSEIELIRHFMTNTRPILVTKPKLFIIQASVGDKCKEVVQPLRLQKDSEVKLGQDYDYTLPVESDLLVLHSTYTGKPNDRNDVSGSLFIQTLCQKIDQLAATRDLEDILTEVNHEIAMDIESCEDFLPNRYRLKMPVATSSLIRKLYLTRFGKEPLCSVVESQIDSIEPKKSTSMLDSETTKISTPVYTESCACFLEHFKYMKECLDCFLQDHPDDVTARSFSDVATAFQDGPEFNSTKEKMLRGISKYLEDNGVNDEDLKYLHPYSKKL